MGGQAPFYAGGAVPKGLTVVFPCGSDFTAPVRCVCGGFFALLFRRTLIVAVLMTPCTLMIVGVLALHGLALLRAAGTASSSESPCFDSLCAVCLCVRHIISDNRPNLCFGAHVGAVTLSVVCGT
jgi:hypothetical protein